MRWLTNTYDPRRPDWAFTVRQMGDETREQAAGKLRRFISTCTIGAPRATEQYSTEQLAKMGMVGLYSPEEEGA